jgi:hypothetical protein
MEVLVKKILLFVCLLALCNLTLYAQTEGRPRIVHTPEKSAAHVPPQPAAAGLKKIYSNLGSQTDLYDDESGWVLEGPGFNGFSSFGAIPFTPKSNSHILQVGAAMHYFTGDNQVNLSIYSDANGAPGTLLAGPVTVTNLPESGVCCTLAVANFAPLAVTGGTQYWVVIDTPLTGAGSDFDGEWSMVAATVPIAFNDDGLGWTIYTANDLPAAAVLGTIP